MKHISIVTPCYNEEENVERLYSIVKVIFSKLKGYTFEHIFIDNASIDGTQEMLKKMADEDSKVKVIINSRNFGHIRSPYYGMLQANGDAVIMMAADFQDPPEMIPQFLKHWEAGYKIAIGVKNKSKEFPIMFLVRKIYYKLINKLADISMFENFTGFGLFDRKIVQILRAISDPYPYLRGMIAELGFDVAKVEFTQPRRERGITKNNFYTLYDIALLGITNHSKIPLRIAAFLGFLLSVGSLLVAMGYFVAKLVFWNHFSVGIAPLIIALFFFSSVQLFFIGIIGEYLGSIHTQVLNRPLVIEKERINFDEKTSNSIK
jgi:polyisoprenyl-phosphate glycosyltransferase